MIPDIYEQLVGGQTYPRWQMIRISKVFAASKALAQERLNGEFVETQRE